MLRVKRTKMWSTYYVYDEETDEFFSQKDTLEQRKAVFVKYRRNIDCFRKRKVAREVRDMVTRLTGRHTLIVKKIDVFPHPELLQHFQTQV